MQSESCHDDNKGIHSDVRREGSELRSQHLNQSPAEEGPSLPLLFPSQGKEIFK